MASRLECERANRDAIEDHLGRAQIDVDAQVEWLRNAYRRASMLMFAKEPGRLCATLTTAPDKEGVRAAIVVSVRILSMLHYRDSFLPMSAILDELAPAVREWELQAVAPLIAAVIHLEKERDFYAM